MAETSLILIGLDVLGEYMKLFSRIPSKFYRKKSDNNVTVNFLICGTQKGGTTALDSYLRGHPQICMANLKEVHFFDNDKLFRCGDPDYSLYHSNFSPAPSHKIIGEATPIYMYWQDSARRIWQYNPDMKLIVLLRNPIERAYSHWNMERHRNAEDLSFWDAIKSEEMRCRQGLPCQHRVFSYVDRGFYIHQLKRVWHYFGKDNVLVVKSEYLKAKPQEVLAEIYGFLGVYSVAAGPKEEHSIPYQSRMTGQEKGYLRSVFEYEIKGLERLLGWDCSDWLRD